MASTQGPYQNKYIFQADYHVTIDGEFLHEPF